MMQLLMNLTLIGLCENFDTHDLNVSLLFPFGNLTIFIKPYIYIYIDKEDE